MKTLMIATGMALAAQFAVQAQEAKAEVQAEAAKTGEADKKPDVTVEISGDDRMQFDKKEFTVKEGQTVALVFKNIGKQPKNVMGHNIVILKPGTDVIAFANAGLVNKETTGLPNEEELKKQVIACSKVLGPSESETITFIAPEAGNYDYICTFPGHFAVMKGVMTVSAK